MADDRFDNAADKTAAEEKLADERQKDFTRRALLRAGWMVPVVTTVIVPAASAQTTPPPHTDHADAPHTDHADIPHTDHVDAPHQDHQDHQDAHADSHADAHGDAGPHADAHSDVHQDTPTPHSDVPHVDAMATRSSVAEGIGDEADNGMTDVDIAGDPPIEAACVPCRRRVESFASDGESLLYSAARDEASALNRTATEIWELCDGTKSIGAIARVLGQRYGVDQAYLLADVTTAVAICEPEGWSTCHDDRGVDPA